MSNLEWESQRVFLAVLRSGSLSGAARLLGIAQATARRRLENLEAGLGVKLFTRTSAGLTPTASARGLTHHVESMAIAAEAFNRMASGETEASHGVVRLTGSDFVGVEILPGILRQVQQHLPGLKFEISINDALEDIARQEADIAVRLLRPSGADIVARRTGVLRVGLYASADCLARHGSPVSLDVLRRGPLIGPDRRSADLRRWVEVGLCDADQCFAVATDNHLAQFAALKAGLGFGLCPTVVAAPYDLIPVLPDAFGFEVEVWIAMHNDLRKVGRIARTFERLGEALNTYLAD
jgi:DNA-binding transcriptional LysR family regulator